MAIIPRPPAGFYGCIRVQDPAPQQDVRPRGLGPVRDPRAKNADLIVHLLALTCILAALPGLYRHGMGDAIEPSRAQAVLLYASVLVGLVSTSMAYHHAPIERWRDALLRADQSVIFLKIASTYTVLAAITGTDLGMTLEVLWFITLLACGLRIAGPSRMRKINLTLYLAISLAGFYALQPAIGALHPTARNLVMLGGILYLTGVLVFVRDGMRYRNSIWHSFVFIATGCIYGAILIELGQMPERLDLGLDRAAAGGIETIIDEIGDRMAGLGPIAAPGE